MAKRTVAIRAILYIEEKPDPKDPNRVRRHVRKASRGDTIDTADLLTEDLNRLEESGAFGGGEAAAEESGGTPDVINVVDVSDDELDQYLVEAEPNVGDTVALAGDDPESAQRVLDSENRVSSGDPRAGVVKGLEKIIG